MIPLQKQPPITAIHHHSSSISIDPLNVYGREKCMEAFPPKKSAFAFFRKCKKSRRATVDDISVFPASRYVVEKVVSSVPVLRVCSSDTPKVGEF